MRDEWFELFITEFGEATSRKEVPKYQIDQWQGKLPDKLLEYWSNEGWASYQNGLFSIVNPNDYQDIVDEWLEGTPYIAHDTYYPIARSAFGNLYLCGEKTGVDVTVCCNLNTIYATKGNIAGKSNEDLNDSISIFLGSMTIESCDICNNDMEYMFHPALKKLGPLADNEIYGFVPALVAGGEISVNNIQKVDCSIHLSILRQFADPHIQEF